mgnify:CR=1 FL=1
MERLTKRDTDGQAMMDCEKCKADWMGKHGKPMAECTALYCRNRLLGRLAEYEDTGLEPEAVETVKLALAAKHMVDLETLNNTQISRLVELAEADKDGRVVVLPCKPGAEVWATRHDKVWPMYFVAPTLSAVCPDMPVHCQKDTCAGGPCKAYFGTDAREFGKTVFLTREEAEKALKERGKA